MLSDSQSNSTADTIIAAAQRYIHRGWNVIPIPHRSKKSRAKGWQKWRIQLEDLDRWFPASKPWNIGVLLGEPSGWLIDVDLDHLRAIELAPQYLPATPLMFGRAGKPKSHWLYHATKPVTTHKFASRSSGMLVEVRSTGQQTVFPPSTHESGEAIQWIDEDVEPANIDPDELVEAASRLADAVRIELGEKAAPKQKEQKQKDLLILPSLQLPASPVQIDMSERAKQCLEAMERMRLEDSKDGSRRLFAAACRCVEHDLDDTTAVKVIQEYARHIPFRVSWSAEAITKRLRDAEKRCQRGQAILKTSDGYIVLGGREPNSGRLILSPTRTLPTAKSFVRDFYLHPDGPTLVHYAGLLLDWRNNRFAELEDGEARQVLQSWLHAALRYRYNSATKLLELVDFESNPSTVRSALESIKSHVHLPSRTPCPSWLVDTDKRPRPEEIIACRSLLLHLPTMKRIQPTPLYFNTCALDFDPDPKAPLPRKWLDFLHQLVDGDIQSFDLIQQWFGYTLVGDTSQQKMLLIVGPRRSGKGTIARVLAQIVGPENVCGPTTSSLAGPFGLQPLIGKSLAIVSDARFSGEGISTVIERLLCISGEDQLTIDRKNIGSVTLKLPTRFMFLTNEFPRLTDASGALAGRFVILRLTQSFYGREDKELTRKLLAEKPGILNWAIEGWHLLQEAGHFTTPQIAEEAAQAIQDLSSPVGAFVRQCCLVGPDERVTVNSLYEAWRTWCLEEGRTSPATRQSFGRDLTAAVDGVARRRGTNDETFYAGISLKNPPSKGSQ